MEAGIAGEDITIVAIMMMAAVTMTTVKVDTVKAENATRIFNLLAPASAKDCTHKEKDHEPKGFLHCFTR